MIWPMAELAKKNLREGFSGLACLSWSQTVGMDVFPSAHLWHDDCSNYWSKSKVELFVDNIEHGLYRHDYIVAEDREAYDTIPHE